VKRKTIVLLLISLLVGAVAMPARACPEHSPRAQSGGPLPQATSPQTTVHIVQRSETLFSIAQRYGLTVDAITHANGIPDPRQIYIGQRLVIPGVNSEADAETAPYLVQVGDTLASIARRHYTTWQRLVQVNGLLSPNAIYAGQVIKVPAINAPAGVSAEGAARSPMSGGTLYIMRSDDTLFRVALRYGVSPWTLASVSHIANPALVYPGQELVIPNSEPGLLPEPFVFVEVRPLPVAQGTTLFIVARTTGPVKLGGGLFGQEVRFAGDQGLYYGLVGVHVFTEPGLYELELTAVDEENRSAAITTEIVVQAGSFGYERIDVPADRTSLLDPDVIAADRERLDAVRRTFTTERYWDSVFQRPCVGNISSHFGTHRSYNGNPYTSYHSGVDFKAPTGTPVYAPAGGTIVLTGSLALWGNLVVIDHGWGVLTGYGHLSSAEVQVGQQVAPGDLIGKVGNTGLSTGAHLHWEMWVGGTSVSALQWLEESNPWSQYEWLAVGG
jgi:murein DD-endopeptidase MepM/ murein hydrolase activator NlpD